MAHKKKKMAKRQTNKSPKLNERMNFGQKMCPNGFTQIFYRDVYTREHNPGGDILPIRGG